MYCDSCGTRLSQQAKYCSRCGQRICHEIEDTQPLPMLTDKILYGDKQAAAEHHKTNFFKKVITRHVGVRRVLYDAAMLAVVFLLIYVLGNFQSIKEYQRLTGIGGGLLVCYLWWKR